MQNKIESLMSIRLNKTAERVYNPNRLSPEGDGSLESIVFSAKQSTEIDSLESVFSDKCKTAKAGVRALLLEIQLRESLNSHLLNKIEEDISRQTEKLSQLDFIKYPGSMELSESLNQQRTKLKDNILELHREKRKEYLECWKDLMSLKRYLQISLKEYWNHARKREVLGM